MPGFLAGPRSTAALEHVLRQADWDVRVAAVGRNAGPAHRSVDTARTDLIELSEQTGQKVTVIGHSRGAQFSRILAIQRPDLVSQVIGFGTPIQVKYPMFFVMKVPAEVLDKAWRVGVFGPVDKVQEDATEDLRFAAMPPSIEFVSIWSKSDGIVDWRLSRGQNVVNIEVDASHLGMFNSIAGISGVAQALGRQDLDVLPAQDTAPAWVRGEAGDTPGNIAAG